MIETKFHCSKDILQFVIVHSISFTTAPVKLTNVGLLPIQKVRSRDNTEVPEINVSSCTSSL